MDLLAKSLMAAELAPPDEWEKAMAAGAAVSNPGSAPGEGFPLRSESMETTAKITGEKKKRKKKKKYLTKSEALACIRQRFPGLTDPETIEGVWQMASQNRSEKRWQE